VATLGKVRTHVADGRIPARPLAEGAVLSIAALLIIIPGFVTDLFGIALFIPAVREALWRGVRRRIQIRSAAPDAASAPRPAVIDLDRSEYGAASPRRPRTDSPWRRGGGSEA
jgi:UPF0716 protein FxsA